MNTEYSEKGRNAMMLRISCMSALLLLGILTSRVSAQQHTFDSLMTKLDDLGQYLLLRNHDSTYIQNFSNEWTFKLVAVSKHNYFKIKDRTAGSGIRYRPDRRVNLGIGFAYRWFSLDIVFNVGIEEESGFKYRDFLDFQANIFSSKQYVAASLQYYYGYNLTDHTGISDEIAKEEARRDDVRTINVGLQYLYAFNYDKFSLKAPFILNERQLKSAGSPLIGAGFNLNTIDADSSMVPSAAQPDFDPELHLRDLNTLSLSLHGGYMYTLVWKKHFFLTLGLIPGMTINKGDYQTAVRKPMNLHLTFSLNTMNAIGYNGRRFFCGVQYLGAFQYIRIEKKMKTDIGQGKLKGFVGYRFQRKKS